MRRKLVITVLVTALAGVVGAEGIMKARDAALPKGTITVEEVNSTVVQANSANPASERLAAITGAAM